MKKVVSIICIVLMISMLLTPLGRAEEPVKVEVNGTLLQLDVSPVIINDRTMVPLRAIFEALGATVEWDGNTNTITGTKEQKKIILQIDNKTATVDNQQIELDVPATLVNDRTMVPARFVAESLGANVQWAQETNTVKISMPSKGDISLIDYKNPDKYLSAGPLTALSDSNFDAIKKELNISTKTLSDIQKVFSWKNKNFKSVSAAGKFIGKLDVNQIIANKEITGCHDNAVLVGSILRKFGFPVVMVEAIGVKWAYDYPEKTQIISGHVFIEVYLNGKWILFDPTGGSYILEYDLKNPEIPISNSLETKGHYAILKGLDPVDYGVDSFEQLRKQYLKYPDLFKNGTIKLTNPSYTIGKF